MRKHNKSDMTVSEQLDYIKEQICDDYCKYPEDCRSFIKDPDEAWEYLMRTHCATCPLNEL